MSNDDPRGALPDNMKRHVCLAATAAIVATIGFDRPVLTPVEQIDRDRISESVDAIVSKAVRDDGLPSVSVAVAIGADVVVTSAYGTADLENGVGAEAPTIYRIGSITKQFTAAAVLRLVEEKRVALEDQVGRYVEGLAPPARLVTIRQLLNHTSGIRSFTALPAFPAKERLDLDDEQLLDLVKDEPLDFEPGTNFLYNNTAYYLLAMLIEQVTGRSYANYMQDHVFGPLGLTETSVCDDRRVLPHRASGYTVSDGVLQNAPYISMGPPKGGGNICSSARDLARWWRALSTGRLITSDSYRAMTEPGALVDGRRIAYGFGLYLSALDGHTEISHGGGIVGFTGFLGFYPADDLIAVTLTNSDAAHLYDGHLAREIVRAIAQRRRTESVVASHEPTVFERYVGTYQIGSAMITVARSGEHLVVDSGGSVEHLWEREFVSRGDGRFVAVGNPELQLAFTPAQGPSTRLSILLSGRAFGDAIRVPRNPGVDR